MRLERRWTQVHGLCMGSRTRLADGVLEVDAEALRAVLEADARLQRVRIDVAHPGEACRIGRVFDVMAPRAKLDGGVDFPGVLGRLARVGSGRTRALAKVAAVVTDRDPGASGPWALIDMAGPAAALTAYAHTHNLVLSAWPAPGVGRQDYLSAIRSAGLKSAVYLAHASDAGAADVVEVFDLPALTRAAAAWQGLPRVAYVFQIHSHQCPTGVDEGILYGDPVRQLLPTPIHPNEILDGADDGGAGGGGVGRRWRHLHQDRPTSSCRGWRR
jgi:glycine reductase